MRDILMKKKTKKASKRFNLVDEKWLPVADIGLVSLKDIFTNAKYKALGGNPIQKIALTKLFLAISQSAYTPEDDKDWAKMGAKGIAKKTLEYLDKHKNCFWLYGEKPFLQMRSIKKAEKKSFGTVLPEIATGNTTVLSSSQVGKNLDDAERALVVVQLMGFGLGGKKTDNNIVLSKGYKGKSAAGKPGTSVGFIGYLHIFLIGKDIISMIWLNLITKEQVKGNKMYPKGIGRPPWEKMPIGESCDTAKMLQGSIMGRLVPVSRFVLLADDGIHYSEGILHPGYKEGVVDPSVIVNFAEKKTKVIWTDPEKRPWRQLTSMLSFIETASKGSFECQNLQFGVKRAREKIKYLGVWSGGLRVKSNAGEQFVAGSCDYVESEIMFDSSWLGGGDKGWFIRFKQEMSELETLSNKIIFGRVAGYYKSMQAEGIKQAAKATGIFWQMCERKAQMLIDACADKEKLKKMRPIFGGYVNSVYNQFCPKDTARQIDEWAKNRPNLEKYINFDLNKGGKE